MLFLCCGGPRCALWVLRTLFLRWPHLASLVASLPISFYLYGWLGEFKVVLLIKVHILIFFGQDFVLHHGHESHD